MEVNHPVGIFAVVMAVVSFYGCTYAVIALNVGWRFGYWLASATFGGLMVLMALFWFQTALGPRGEEAHWIPVAASAEVTDARFGEQSFTSPASYPAGSWRVADAEDDLASEFTSAASACLTTDPEELLEEEREACEQAQELLPSTADLPKFDGVTVAMSTEATEVAFAQESGATLAQATIVPLTRDPRLEDDYDFPADADEPTAMTLGDPFQLVAVRDQGSIRLPALGAIAIFSLYFAFHLYGLRRAERRKLSPVA